MFLSAEFLRRITGCFGALASIALGQTVQPPAFLPAEGSSSVNLPVVVTSSTGGAVIHYTVNGVDPTIYDPTVLSGGTVVVKKPLTLKAKAWLGSNASTITSKAFEVTGDVSVGATHLLALKSNGEVFAWGNGNSGKLGNNSAAGNQPTPTLVKKSSTVNFTDAMSIAATQNHSIAVDNLGQVWAWGDNGSGAVGNNTIANQLYAVQVLKSATAGDWLTNCNKVAGGTDFSLALSSSGNVYGWGKREYLADGSATGTRLFAVKVKTVASGNPELTNIVDIAAGVGQGLAREANALQAPGSNGHVWAWGVNSSGELGLGTTPVASQLYATKVKLDASTDLTDAWDIATNTTHSLIVRWKAGETNLQGSVWAMGARANGRLGDNAGNTGKQAYPVQVVKGDSTPLLNIAQVAAGDDHSLALDQSGNVWAWGANASGQLGDGTTAAKSYAVKVRNPANTADLAGIVRIAAYGVNSAAVASDGTVYVWGNNTYGQHGDGTIGGGNATLPQAVPSVKVLPNSPAFTSYAATQPTPGNVTLTATVSDADGPLNIQKVEFFLQGTLVGTKTSAPWALSLSSLMGGSYHSYAIVTDFNGNTDMSLPATFSVADLDSDHDGLLDSWEIAHFGNLSQNASGDPDGDGVTNLQEQSLGTNPTVSTDTDADGLKDDWEKLHFGNLSQNASGDPDGDKVTNAEEWTLGTSPVSVTAQDTDADGLKDDWELKWFGNLSKTGSEDPDGDHVSNILEFIHSTNPASAVDTDADGLFDDWEIRWFGNLGQIASGDFDGDRVTNAQELVLNTHPGSAMDYDHDGLPDDWEVFHFGNTAHDAAADPDLDGLSNALEWEGGSDPDSAVDSDSDGLPDDWEVHWFNGIGVQGAGGDPDADRVTNAEELAQGTNPDSAADSDSDGLPDDWEKFHFGDLSRNAGGDEDGDGVSNLKEFSVGSDPASSMDSDSDGLPDDWENYWFANLSQTATADADGDGLENWEELILGTNPMSWSSGGGGIIDGNLDSDGDGIPDYYETGVLYTDPWDPESNGGDTDGDGLSDGYEMYYFGNTTSVNGMTDTDGDALSNETEGVMGTNPRARYEPAVFPNWEVFLPR